MYADSTNDDNAKFIGLSMNRKGRNEANKEMGK